MLKQKCFFITLLATFGLISVILQIYENTYLQFKENGYFSWMTHHGIDDNDTTDGNCTRRDEEKVI